MKKHVLFYACLVLGLTLFGQDQPKVEKKYFVSEDGKLFWQGEQPLYLFVSQSPDGSDAKRLENKELSEYTNPMFLDTEGANYIRSRWAYKDGKYAPGQPEISFEIFRDSQAPKSVVGLSGARKFVINGKTYYGAGLEMTVTSTDGNSGVSRIMVSEGGSAYSEYTAPIKPSSDGVYKYLIYAVDNVGNVEEAIAKQFILDAEGPTTAHLIEGDNMESVLSARSIIKLNAEDKASGTKTTYYRIDEGEYRTYSNRIAVSNLEDGEHVLSYYSIDYVGNKEEARTFNFYLDKTAPKVEISVEGDTYEKNGKTYVAGNSQVVLSATDNKAGVKDIKYRIDGGVEQIYSGPFDYPQDHGEHTITYWATDNVQNENKMAYTGNTGDGMQAFFIDMEAPELMHNFDGSQFIMRDTVFVTSGTQIVLSGKDKDSGLDEITYSIDGGEMQRYSDPITVTSEGVHQIKFKGSDFVLNESEDTFLFVVDNTGPKVEAILSMEPVGTMKLTDRNEPIKVYSMGTKLYLGATDQLINTKEIYSILNNGKEVVYSQPIELKQKGEITYLVRATDQLGNETKTKAVTIYIK